MKNFIKIIVCFIFSPFIFLGVIIAPFALYFAIDYFLFTCQYAPFDVNFAQGDWEIKEDVFTRNPEGRGYELGFIHPYGYPKLFRTHPVRIRIHKDFFEFYGHPQLNKTLFGGLGENPRDLERYYCGFLGGNEHGFANVARVDLSVIKNKIGGKMLWLKYMSMHHGQCYIALKKRQTPAKKAILFGDEIASANPADVEVLSLANAGLDGIPEKLRAFANLKELYMPCNNIKFTSGDIGVLASLKNLRVLDIRFNNISASPDPNLSGLTKCENLQKIYIAGEKICSGGKIPNVFAKMKNLKLLSISAVSEPPRFPPEYANKSARLKIKFIEKDNGADSVEIKNAFDSRPVEF